MARGSRLTRLDAFTKTVEDARVRTTTGGIVTISSIVLILYLLFNEYRDYSKIIIQPELVVDKTRGMFQKVEVCDYPHILTCISPLQARRWTSTSTLPSPGCRASSSHWM